MAIQAVPRTEVAEPQVREERDMRLVELVVAAVAILASVVLWLPK
jgi:hypothetical protein